jgi:CRP-like cAMP-binding protein
MNSDIMEKLVTVEYRPGETLFKEGEVSYHFFIIQEGEVVVQRKEPDGTILDLATLGPGTSVGEFAHIDRKPRSATVIAKTPVTAVMVSEDAYEELLSELPTWVVAMIEGLVERLRAANEKIQELRHLDQKTKQEIQNVLAAGGDGSTQWDLDNPFQKTR